MKRTILGIATSTILTLGIIGCIASSSPENGGAPLVKAPVGSIIAWSGDLAFLPANWKVCDGSMLKKSDYGGLYRVISDNWKHDAEGDDNLFRIPDLRGMFLRGVNGSRADVLSDPDKNERLPSSGSISNDVGSIQRQSTKVPNSPFKSDVSIFIQTGGRGLEHGSGNPDRVTQGDNVNPGRDMIKTVNTYGGDKETRPNNAYVFWIIRVK